MTKKAEVKLAAHLDDNRLRLQFHNGTPDQITVVAHTRYLLVELLDERGQFVRGESSAAAAMPGKKDFVDVPAAGDVTALSLEVTRDGGRVTVGDVVFDNVPAKTEFRVTYKPDALVPNLPSSKRRSFFRGPVQSDRVPFG